MAKKYPPSLFNKSHAEATQQNDNHYSGYYDLYSNHLSPLEIPIEYHFLDRPMYFISTRLLSFPYFFDINENIEFPVSSFRENDL